MARTGVIFSIAILLATVVLAFPSTPLQLSVDVQLVLLNVMVDDATGKPLLNLNREDFTILEDGEPREIKSFEPAETPYNILLLFDKSLSTKDQWSFVVRAILRFIDQMPEQHRVALAVFDAKPKMLLTWRSKSDFKRQSFALNEDGGGSNVYGALEWATQVLRPVKGRKGVIVFTDGVDNLLSKKLVSFDRNGTPSITSPENDSEFQKMLRTVTQSGAHVYFVAVNTDENPDPDATSNAFDTMQHKAARLRMSIVANRANGVLHLPKALQDVGQLYEQIGRELGHAYTIGFTPKTTVRDGSRHSIQVRTRDKTLRATALRDEYYAQ